MYEQNSSIIIDGVVTEEPGDSAPLLVAPTPIVAVVATPILPRPNPKPFIGPIQPGGIIRPATSPITPTPVVVTARPVSPARGHEEKKASPTPTGSSNINAEALRQVLDFGFPEHDARRALARFDNNAERAVNALLCMFYSHNSCCICCISHRCCGVPCSS
jgi:hypothetical protein